MKAYRVFPAPKQTVEEQQRPFGRRKEREEERRARRRRRIRRAQIAAFAAGVSLLGLQLGGLI